MHNTIFLGYVQSPTKCVGRVRVKITKKSVYYPNKRNWCKKWPTVSKSGNILIDILQGAHRSSMFKGAKCVAPHANKDWKIIVTLGLQCCHTQGGGVRGGNCIYQKIQEMTIYSESYEQIQTARRELGKLKLITVVCRKENQETSKCRAIS